MTVAADVSLPPGVQSTSTVPTEIPASIEAVMGCQADPPAAARLPLRNTPDPSVDHVAPPSLISGACTDNAVAFAPVKVSKTATGPVLTVTVAVEDEPC